MKDEEAKELIEGKVAVINQRNGQVVVNDLEEAITFFQRFRGLQFRASLPPKGGLWLAPCTSIHMFFMRFPIDVVWLNSQKVVLEVSSKVQPWYGMAFCSGAMIALELPQGNAKDVRIGDELRRHFG